MLKIDHVETYGWEAAIRGMRNPMNSWEKSDSIFYIKFDAERDIYPEGWDINDRHVTVREPSFDDMVIGPVDYALMRSLASGGPVHAKYRRFLTITMDILAPLYWWKEFDTYKVGTVANSCSTMHKIQAKEFTLDDFSHEHLVDDEIQVTWEDQCYADSFTDALYDICGILNAARDKFLETGDKKWWWQMIQLLPSSYNQRRTVLLNYEVASHIYPDRKNHKLDEWRVFCDVLEKLPFSELITGKNGG